MEIGTVGSVRGESIGKHAGAFSYSETGILLVLFFPLGVWLLLHSAAARQEASLRSVPRQPKRAPIRCVVKKNSTY
jgi:hypothetical protein